jgi:hypothetical protein
MIDNYQARLTDEGMEDFETRLRDEEASKAIALNMDPGATEQTIQTKLSAMQFLKDKLTGGKKEPPKDSAKAIAMEGRPLRLTPGQRIRFGRYARAIEDPAASIMAMFDGRATAEEVEALRLFVPEALDEAQDVIKKQAREAVSQHGELAKWATRQLAIALEQSPDTALTTLIQKQHAAAREQQKPGSRPPSPESALARSFETQVQRALS